MLRKWRQCFLALTPRLFQQLLFVSAKPYYAFLKLMGLQPASIIMYCFLASFAVSPNGMLRNYNPKGNKLPCIEIDASVAEMLPLSIDEVFRSIIELADVDLLTIVNMENNSMYVVINPIPEKLVSNGTLGDFVDFVNSQRNW